MGSHSGDATFQAKLQLIVSPDTNYYVCKNYELFIFSLCFAASMLLFLSAKLPIMEIYKTCLASSYLNCVAVVFVCRIGCMLHTKSAWGPPQYSQHQMAALLFDVMAWTIQGLFVFWGVGELEL